MFNQKGQTFDVFKLVIAAIIAVAILGILMGIMGSDIFGLGQEPVTEAARLLNSKISALGSMTKGGEVKFTPKTGINTGTLAQKSGSLSANQICFSKGELEDNTDFTVTEKILNYTGSSAFIAKFLVVCDSGNKLVQTLTDYAVNKDIIDDAGDCGCADADPTNTDSCCIVALAKRVS